MNVLMVCPANVATGGVESIHKFAYELNQVKGIDVKIFYWGTKMDSPQPEEYKEYGIEYVTALPKDYRDVIIFPEIWANSVIDERYKNCIVAVNWAGVDVYYRNNSLEKQGLFLRRKDTIHLTQMQYAVDHLIQRGVDPKNILHISDVPNELFYEKHEEEPRNNFVLFNPNAIKMTDFQKAVMRKAREAGIQFKPLENLTREQMAHTLRTSKLYIDFGVFSGRERIPREAILSGCCVITSRLGCAGYYEDVALDDKWKFETEPNNIPAIIQTMKYVLANYENCKHEFDTYLQSVLDDRKNIHSDCEKIAKAFKGAKDEI